MNTKMSFDKQKTYLHTQGKTEKRVIYNKKIGLDLRKQVFRFSIERNLSLMKNPEFFLCLDNSHEELSENDGYNGEEATG